MNSTSRSRRMKSSTSSSSRDSPSFKKNKMTKNQIKAGIEKLKKKNDLLKKQISVQPSTAKKMKNLCKKINSLTDVSSDYHSKIRAEKKKHNQLIGQVKDLERKILDAKITFNNRNEKSLDAQISNQIKVLEDRLDRVLTKYNRSISENRKFRQEIETLKEEKNVFDEIYRKMEKELVKEKTKIAGIIEETNSASQESLEAKKELENVETEKNFILSKLRQQFQVLDEIMKNHTNLEEKLEKEDKKRTKELLERKKKFTSLQRKIRKGRIGKVMSDMSLSKTQHLGDPINKSLTELETMLSMSINDILRKFHEKEQNNFSLFTHGSSLNNELEALLIQKQKLRIKTKQLTEGVEYENEKKKKKEITKLRKEIYQIEQESKSIEEEYQKSYENVKKVLSPIKKFFKKVKGDRTNIIEKLGTFEITENNFQDFLGEIEQKIDEKSISYLKKGKKKLLLGPDDNVNQRKILIKPPCSTIETDFEIDEIPLTREMITSSLEDYKGAFMFK